MNAINVFHRSVLALLATIVGCAGQVMIDTHSGWNGTSGFGDLFGEPGPNFTAVATYGQTFTVPAGNPVMSRFSIWMHDLSSFDPDPMVFAGYVMRWSGTRAMGDVLYDSGAVTLGTGFAWHQVTFSNLNLTLAPGQKYVFIVSASKYFNGLESTANMSGLAIDAYSGGAMAYLNNGTDISKWTTQDWATTVQSWDTVFQAQFTVPEPSFGSLVAASIGLGSVVRLRKRRA